MKHLLLIAGLICSFGVQAQVTGISVETYAVHDGLIPELTGYTTYHIYANTTNAEDFISAVYGDSDNPLSLDVDGDVYHSTPGFIYGSEVNTVFFTTFPQLEFDSWMTIGMMSSSDNGVLGSVGVDQAMADFTANGSFIINDPIGGSWYNTIPCDPALDPTCSYNYPQFGGTSNKVLLSQITTNGSFCGVFNVQAFNSGDQTQNQYVNALGFCSLENQVFGCTNPAASNYDPLATQDDYSCILPCTLELVVESITSPTCNGENNGAMVVTATGAQGSDDYYLGEDDVNPSNFGNFSGLFSGSYYVMVEDGAGCQSEMFVEVPVTAPVSVTASLADGISCMDMNDAVIEAIGSGGDGDLQYYFAGDDPSTMSYTTTYPNLSPGTYSLVAVDGNGCTGSSAATQIQNPTAISVFITATSNASCANVSDGQIVLTAAGGVAPSTITYEIDGAAYSSSPIYVNAGTYIVDAIDVNGCTASSEEVVIGPDAIELNAVSTPVLCTDEASGEISWSPSGGEGSINVLVDGELVADTALTNLLPSTYTVVAVDANGCSTLETIDVLNADPVVASVADVIDVLCNGADEGVVVVTATGGTGTFQYSADGNDFVNTSGFDGLAAGQYTFYAQDANGCISGTNAVVAEPDAISITAIASQGDVTGEATIDVNVLGGTPGYHYEWFGPGVDGTTTQDLDGLSSGNYTIEVTDANDCSVSEVITVVTSVNELEGGVVATVFPNPGTGLFNIQLNGWMGGDIQFTLTDATGRIVKAGEWSGAGADFNTQLDIASYENGVYRLSLEANGVPSAIQLVKVQ